jgi:hypothetical protein
MSDDRRIELVNKLIDHDLSSEEYAELVELQKIPARLPDKPWEPNREPPIDVKNEIRMGELNGLMIEDGK